MNYKLKVQLQDNSKKKLNFVRKNRPVSKKQAKQINKLIKKNSANQKLSIIQELEDPWKNQKIEELKEKEKIGAVILPGSQQSYNPNAKVYKKAIEKIIEQQLPKEKPARRKKGKNIRKQKFRPKNLKTREQKRLAQLKRKQNQLQQNWKSIPNQVKRIQKIQLAQQIQLKKKQEQLAKLKELHKKGIVLKGPKLGKRQYKMRSEQLLRQEQYRESLRKINPKNLLIQQRYDSIFRRGLLQLIPK